MKGTEFLMTAFVISLVKYRTRVCNLFSLQVSDSDDEATSVSATSDTAASATDNYATMKKQKENNASWKFSDDYHFSLILYLDHKRETTGWFIPSHSKVREVDRRALCNTELRRDNKTFISCSSTVLAYSLMQLYHSQLHAVFPCYCTKSWPNTNAEWLPRVTILKASEALSTLVSCNVFLQLFLCKGSILLWTVGNTYHLPNTI